jgi:hypothetical protein
MIGVSSGTGPKLFASRTFLISTFIPLKSARAPGTHSLTITQTRCLVPFAPIITALISSTIFLNMVLLLRRKQQKLDLMTNLFMNTFNTNGAKIYHHETDFPESGRSSISKLGKITRKNPLLNSEFY